MESRIDRRPAAANGFDQLRVAERVPEVKTRLNIPQTHDPMPIVFARPAELARDSKFDVHAFRPQLIERIQHRAMILARLDGADDREASIRRVEVRRCRAQTLSPKRTDRPGSSPVA